MSATPARQPYRYRRFEPVEPEWRRFPGWRDVTRAQWRDVRWQRTNSIKTLRALRAVLGDLVQDSFYEDVKRDQATHARPDTMPSTMTIVAARRLPK